MSERKEPRSSAAANACDVALQDATVEIDEYTSLYDDDKFAELLAGYGYAVVPIAAAKEAERLRKALQELIAADDAITAFIIAADPKELGEAEWKRQHNERGTRRTIALHFARKVLAGDGG